MNPENEIRIAKLFARLGTDRQLNAITQKREIKKRMNNLELRSVVLLMAPKISKLGLLRDKGLIRLFQDLGSDFQLRGDLAEMFVLMIKADCDAYFKYNYRARLLRAFLSKYCVEPKQRLKFLWHAQKDVLRTILEQADHLSLVRRLNEKASFESQVRKLNPALRGLIEAIYKPYVNLLANILYYRHNLKEFQDKQFGSQVQYVSSNLPSKYVYIYHDDIAIIRNALSHADEVTGYSFDLKGSKIIYYDKGETSHLDLNEIKVAIDEMMEVRDMLVFCFYYFSAKQIDKENVCERLRMGETEFHDSFPQELLGTTKPK